MNIIRNLVLIAISFAVAYYGTSLWYNVFLGALDYGVFAWIVAIYTLLATLLLTIFEIRHPNWWVTLAVAPLFFMYLYLVLPPFKFISNFDFGEPVYWLLLWSVFVGAGVGLGTLLRKTLTKLAPQFMAKSS